MSEKLHVIDPILFLFFLQFLQIYSFSELKNTTVNCHLFTLQHCKKQCTQLNFICYFQFRTGISLEPISSVPPKYEYANLFILALRPVCGGGNDVAASWLKLEWRFLLFSLQNGKGNVKVAKWNWSINVESCFFHDATLIVQSFFILNHLCKLMISTFSIKARLES